MTTPIDPREHILSEMLAALQRIPDIDLVERNRVFPVSDGTPNAIVLMDGDVIGNTEHPEEVVCGRVPAQTETLTPYIWGYSAGYSDEIGTKRNALYWKIRKALVTDEAFLEVLEEHQAGIAMDEAVFGPTVKATSTGVGAVRIGLFIPYVFDNSNYS